MAQVERAEFRNTTTGWIGAVRLSGRGEEQPVAIAPGDTVWLSVEEQELTANAPRSPADSPFEPQPYAEHDPKTGGLLDEGMRAPLEVVEGSRSVPGVGGREVPGVAPREHQGDGIAKEGVEAPADGTEVEIGAATAPSGDAPAGDYAPGEEVGTPVEEQP